MVRFLLFDDYGPALFVQVFFVYAFRKWRKNTLGLVRIYLIILLFCIWLGYGMIKHVLFPLSGALAIFFFFVATSGKEHMLAALFYLLNQLYLCFFTQNENAAISIFIIYLGFLLLFIICTVLVRIHDRGNGRKVSKFTENLIFLLLEGKIKFFFVFFGLIFQLLPVSGTELWVRALAETLFIQVGFLNILVFLFKSLAKANEEENCKTEIPLGRRELWSPLSGCKTTRSSQGQSSLTGLTEKSHRAGVDPRSPVDQTRVKKVTLE